MASYIKSTLFGSSEKSSLSQSNIEDSSIIKESSHSRYKRIISKPLEYRQEEISRIKEKYPNLVPIMVYRSPTSGAVVPDIDKTKYLAPSDLTFGQFQVVIRKRIRLEPEKALFSFVNGSLIPTSTLLSTVYDIHKSEDGYLYIVYSGENTFG